MKVKTGCIPDDYFFVMFGGAASEEKQRLCWGWNTIVVKRHAKKRHSSVNVFGFRLTQFTL